MTQPEVRIQGIEGLMCHSEVVRQWLGREVGWNKRAASRAEFEELLARRGVEEFDTDSFERGWAFLLQEYRTYLDRAGKPYPMKEEEEAFRKGVEPVDPHASPLDGLSMGTVLRMAVKLVAENSRSVRVAREAFGGEPFVDEAEASEWLRRNATASLPNRPVRESREWPLGWVLFKFPYREIEGSVDVPVLFSSFRGKRAATPVELVHDAVEDLRKRLGIPPLDGARLVLLGEMPRHTIERFHARLEKNADLPALSRMVLVVDPTLGPREVMEAYAEARRKYIKLYRPLDAKACWLAYMYLQVREVYGGTVAHLRSVWNQFVTQHGRADWQYSDDEPGRRRIEKEGKEARKRLLNPGDIVKDGSGEDGEVESP